MESKIEFVSYFKFSRRWIIRFIFCLDTTLYSLVDRYGRFRRTCRLHLHDVVAAGTPKGLCCTRPLRGYFLGSNPRINTLYQFSTKSQKYQKPTRKFLVLFVGSWTTKHIILELHMFFALWELWLLFYSVYIVLLKKTVHTERGCHTEIGKTSLRSTPPLVLQDTVPWNIPRRYCDWVWTIRMHVSVSR